jgi:hypothetical protein
MAPNLRLTAILFVLFLALLSYAAGLPGITAPDRLAQKDDPERSVRDLEQRWLENEDSPDALETILADDFIHVLPMGFISKRDQIDYLREHPRTSRSAKHFDELRGGFMARPRSPTASLANSPKAAARRKRQFSPMFLQSARACGRP